MANANNPRYTAVAIALHWLIALAIVLLILVGWYMGDLPDDAPGKEELYQMHKSFGITVLILTIARIVWRAMNPPPPLPTGLSPLERFGARVTHFGFYVLMLAMPLSGWLLVSTAYEFDIATVLFGIVSWPDIPGVGFLANETGHGAVEFVHSKLAWIAIGLLVLHVAGAVKHEFDGEGVLHRMLPGLFGESDGLVRPPRGTLAAFGLAGLVFTAIAGSAAIAQGARSAPADTAALEAGNWTVDYETSSISFSGLHEGDPYTGEFEDWRAAITFDPNTLDTARASVIVATGSASASKKLYTDTLSGPEWFHVSAFPEAQVNLTDFESLGQDRYRAQATLTLKGATVTAPFDFGLAIENGTARMTGETSLSRGALDLGMASDPGADWVGDEVQVTVEVNATRQAGD